MRYSLGIHKEAALRDELILAVEVQVRSDPGVNN
jgi:hypothetical protein